MATFSLNSTISISSAVSASQAIASGSTIAVYTCPAESYAIVQVGISNVIFGSANAAVLVDSRRVTEKTASTSFEFQAIYVGPGQALSVSIIATSGSPTVTVQVSGVEFINSP